MQYLGENCAYLLERFTKTSWRLIFNCMPLFNKKKSCYFNVLWLFYFIFWLTSLRCVYGKTMCKLASDDTCHSCSEDKIKILCTSLAFFFLILYFYFFLTEAVFCSLEPAPLYTYIVGKKHIASFSPDGDVSFRFSIQLLSWS